MAEVRRNLFTPHAAENTVSRMDRAGAKRPVATPEDTDRSTSEGSKRARKRVAVTATTGKKVRVLWSCYMCCSAAFNDV